MKNQTLKLNHGFLTKNLKVVVWINYKFSFWQQQVLTFVYHISVVAPPPPEATPEAESEAETRKNVTTLITFIENRKPQNNGSCKLEIDLLSQALFVKPKNENFNDITATFGWKFIRSKNILFIFANLDSQDFVLVFKNEEICIKVWNVIFKNSNVDSVEEDLLKERFLNPLFKNAFKNWRMKEILEEWIQKFDEKEKNEYLQLLKWHHDNPEICDEEEIDIKDVKVKSEPLPNKNRKRKHHEFYTNDLSESAKFVDQSNFEGLDGCDDNNYHEFRLKQMDSSYRFTKVIDKSKFKILNLKTAHRLRRKLLIFTSSDGTKCYEFSFHRSKKYFYHRCCDGLSSLKAIFDLDENRKDCIKIEDKKHRCSPILYEPEKYFEMKIVKKPDFEVLENCAIKSRRMLIIFDSNDRNKCYEYSWRSSENIFNCRGCASQRKSWITAEIFNENTEEEFVLFSKEEHVCKPRKHDPETYFSSNAIVISPNFEMQIKFQNGNEIKTLNIFVENDRKLCYAYYCCINNLFYCKGCRRKQTNVGATICKNAENEEYVILSNLKHVCSPRKYVPQNEPIILRPPKIKFVEATEMQKPKLFIFDSTDPELCYTFSQKLGRKQYYCLGCASIADRNNKKMNKTKCNQTKKIVTVILDKDDEPNGEYFVKFNDGEKHICQPKKFEPEKYETKILKPTTDYILFRNKGRNGESIHLVIFHPDDRKLCYQYSYYKKRKHFRCPACHESETLVTAKLHQDFAGNEYLTMNQKKHICTPLKYSTIVKPNTVILEKSGLGFEEPKKKEEIDKDRIIRYPKFELRQNFKGVPERRLIVLFNDNQKLCYDYRYHQSNANFICKKCYVSAKILNDEEIDNEKYVVLGENKHKCDPVKYEPEKKIVETNETQKETSNFMVFNRNDETKTTKLVIFISSTKELCYEYSYHKRSKTFQCCGCKILNNLIAVKLLKNFGDGKEYVKFLKNEHVCSPKKFLIEEFQPKIVPENCFKLCSNKNGKPNSKLILFDSEKDGFVYEYYLYTNNVFTCLQCSYFNTRVLAKLLEKENGEKYLELSSTQHICESKKYEQENPKLTSNFVIHFNDSGVPNSKLIILNNDDKSFGYRYYLEGNLFRCTGCKTKRKYSSAKLLTDNDGNQSLEFGKNEHVCAIKNLKKEKLYFCDFKFAENGNVLITNDPIQKNRCFKFAYDEKLGTFCCSKCLEKKKKYITATICKENDEKEFVLLNVPHYCTSILK